MTAPITRADAARSFFIYVKDQNSGRITRLAIPSDVQVGTKDVPAELQVTGRISISSIDLSVSLANSTVQLDGTDTIANIHMPATSLGTNTSVVLPSNPREGQIQVVKDVSGNSSTNNIVLKGANGTTIDGASTQTISTAYGSLVVYWNASGWQQFAAGAGASSGGSGAPTNATYLTLSNNATLSNERVLSVSGSNITLADSGANSTALLDLSVLLATGSGTYTLATVKVDQWGRVTGISNGSVQGPVAGTGIGVSGNTVSLDLGVGNALVLSTGSGGGVTVAFSGSNPGAWIDLSGSLITTGSLTVNNTLTVSNNTFITGTLYLSGSPDIIMAGQIQPTGTYSVNGPTQWGALSIYAKQAAPNIDHPTLGIMWNNGFLSQSLMPNPAFGGHQMIFRAAGGSTTEVLFWNPTFASQGVNIGAISLTGSYGQIRRSSFGSTTANTAVGLWSLNSSDSVWVGQDSNTGGFFYYAKFAFSNAGVPNNNTHTTSGSFFAGFTDNAGSSALSAASDWETIQTCGRMGAGWSARFAGNNIVNKNPGTTGSYNWQMMATPNARLPAKTDTGIPIIVEHWMELMMYMPPGVSSSVYWSLTDVTTGQQALGQFLSSNNVIPPPTTGGTANVLQGGITANYLTASAPTAPGIQLMVAAHYMETPY